MIINKILEVQYDCSKTEFRNLLYIWFEYESSNQLLLIIAEHGGSSICFPINRIFDGSNLSACEIQESLWLWRMYLQRKCFVSFFVVACWQWRSSVDGLWQLYVRRQSEGRWPQWLQENSRRLQRSRRSNGCALGKRSCESTQLLDFHSECCKWSTKAFLPMSRIIQCLGFSFSTSVTSSVVTGSVQCVCVWLEFSWGWACYR